MRTFLAYIFYWVIISLVLICGWGCKQSPVDKQGYEPERIGRMLVADMLSRNEMMFYRSNFLNTVHYAEACAGMGAVRLATTLKDSSLLLSLELKYNSLFQNFDTLPANHVDANVIGILPLSFYAWNKKPDYYKMGVSMADKQWDNPRSNGLSNQTRYWIDDIYMIGSIQVEAYKATGNPIYLSRASIEIRSYLERLQQENGLFHHGPEAPFYWGRGNGWVAVGLAELLSVLPVNEPNYSFILEGYRKMMNALLEYQAPNGMWRQLIDREEAWEESSCTAMFGYAIKVGVDKGLLPRSKYKKSYCRAWEALVNNLSAEGKLKDICVGTGQSKDVEYYLKRPKIIGDLHGQAPMLWFANALLSNK